MQKGQTFNLKKKSKIAVQFKKIKYLAIFIKSNQNETEKTFLSGIVLSGVSEAKLAYDMPVYKADDKKKKEKYTDVVAMFDELGMNLYDESLWWIHIEIGFDTFDFTL